MMSVENVVETMQIVRMTKKRGSLNVGDICGFPVAQTTAMAAAGECVLLQVGVDVDADGNPLREFEGEQLPIEFKPEDILGHNQPTGQFKFDSKTDPFTTDGISKQASLALHGQNLHTVAAVRNFIASLPEGVNEVSAINEIEGVTDAQAEKIVKLYGMVTEHSEE